MDDDIKRLTQETCLALIPQFYDGVLEATRIQQVHDAIIEPFSAAIMRIHRNAYIQTMDADALSELENGLGMMPSGTLEQRRQAIIDALCDPHIVNDATLHTLCQSLAPEYTVYERTDPDALSLGIFTVEEDEQGNLPAVGIVKEIMPTVPQNLALYVGVDTAFDRNVVINHAHFSALWAGLGTVERHVPEIVLFYTINKETGEETRGNKEPDTGAVVKGGTMFEGSKTPRLLNYSSPISSVTKGGTMFEGTKVPAMQSLGNNLFFTISKTPDA